MEKLRKTPLRKWLEKKDETISDFARSLGVSRARAQHWVKGAAMPRGPLLYRLMKRTKLKLPQLLPDIAIQDIRRERERLRRERYEDKVYQMERKLAKTGKRGSDARTSQAG